MKLNKYLLIIIIVSCIPLYNFFITTDLMHTHDGLVHLPRLGAFFKALLDGQIPVRFAGDLNYGYGLPLFNFIYHTPYLIGSLFLSLGFGLVNTFKITLSLSYIFSGIFMFLFARELFKDNLKGFVVTIFYQFATFRFIELLLRGSFGEVYAYTFLPLILYGLTLLLKKVQYKYIVLTAFATTLLVISHNSISLVFFAVCCLFILIFTRGKKAFLASILSLGLGLLLSSYYWMPAILEHKYTYGDLFMKSLYMSHFPPFYMFIAPNFLNSSLFQIEHISVQIGLFHVIGFIIAMVLLVLTRKEKSIEKKVYLFSLLLMLGSFFLMQPVSTFVWENISFLRQFQFPWRIMAVVTFATALTSVAYFKTPIGKSNKLLYGLIFLVIGTTVMYWQPTLGFKKIDESYYWNFPLNTTYYGETDVIWSAGPAKSYPDKRVEVINGEGTISELVKKSNKIEFKINAITDTTVVSHTQYFPGWRVFINGQSVPIQFQDPNWRGELVFDVPKGNHIVKIEFGESRLRFIADIISLITFVGICVFGLIKFFKRS